MILKDDMVLVMALLIVILGISGMSLLLYVSLHFMEQTCGMDVALTIGLSTCLALPYIYILYMVKRSENIHG